MSTVYKWRVYCVTEAADVHTYLPTQPTVCPNNNTHTINSTLTVQEQKISNDIVQVQSEAIPTQGLFRFRDFTINANPNTTTNSDFSFNYPINVICARLVSEEVHRGDSMTWMVNPNQTIGVITTAITAAAVWDNATAYSVDDIVAYNSIKYKCIQAHTNQTPTTIAYWTKQLNKLTVSPTVIQYLKIGWPVQLTDGVNLDLLGECVEINAGISEISTINCPSHNFSAYTTYVQMNIVYFDNVIFSGPEVFDIGESTLGSSYLPKGGVIRCSYTNNSGTTKVIRARVQYYY